MKIRAGKIVDTNTGGKVKGGDGGEGIGCHGGNEAEGGDVWN